MNKKTRAVKGFNLAVLLGGVFVFLATAIIWAGHSYYRSFARDQRDDKERELAAIAELKVQQLTQFRAELVADGMLLFRNKSFSSLVRRYSENPDEAGSAAGVVDWLVKYQSHLDISQTRLLDVSGETMLSAPDSLPPASRVVVKAAADCFKSGQVELLDLYRNDNDQRIYMAILVPVYDLEGEKPLAVVTARVDPELYLYSFIKNWPIPSETAETLLVRQEGDEVLFLNELRHRADTALKMRVPVGRPEFPAGLAVLGKEGVVEGLDYRNEPVLAVVCSVPESPWFMVAKVDMAEAFAELRVRLREVVVFVVLLLLGVGLGLIVIARHQRVSFHKAQLVADEQLRESERRYRGLFENSLTGVALHDIVLDEQGNPVDYIFLQANPAFGSHTGLNESEIIGKRVTQVIPGIEKTDLIQTYGKVALGGEPVTFETFVESMQKHYHITAYQIGEGRFAVLFDDITERKQGEELSRQHALEIEERNDELIRFTYAVSHDLKSPLVTIRSFLGYLEQDMKKGDDGAVAKDMGYIRNAAVRMSQLLDEVLELSRVGRVANPPERVSLQDLVGAAMEMVAGRIDEKDVKVDVTKDPIMLYGDRARLVEVFQNLLDNAAKFTGDQAEPRVEIGVELKGDDTVFFVRDNGQGIDPRHLGKLFGLFEKLDAKSDGTGIGLALVKRIVEVHGGKIWVESDGLGKGTCFWFTMGGRARSPLKPSLR